MNSGENLPHASRRLARRRAYRANACFVLLTVFFVVTASAQEETTYELTNGLRVHLVPDTSATLGTVRLHVNRPLVLEGKIAGVATLTERLLLAGTTTYDRAELERRLRGMNTNLALRNGVFTAAVPPRNLEAFLTILAAIVRAPAFPETEFTRLRAEAATEAAARAADPEYIVGDLIKRLIFGADHPYGERVTSATLGAIELDHVREFHRRYFRPVIAELTVSGPSGTAGLRRAIEREFSGWTSRGSMFAQYFIPAPLPERTRYSFINAPTATTARIEFGYADRLLPEAEDAPAVRRLAQILRTEAAHKPWFPAAGRADLIADPHLGRFRVALTTSPDSVETVLRETRALLYALRDSVPAQDLGGLAYDDVQRAARDYLIPGRMHVVVRGPRALIPVLQAAAAPDPIHFYTDAGEELEAFAPFVKPENP